LAYKDIDYEYRAVNLVKEGGEQFKVEYDELNSMHQVPTFVKDGVAFAQSLAIIEYLEETYPEKKLLPADPVKRAQARQIAEIVNSGIQPIQNLAVLKLLKEYMGSDEKVTPWANHWITSGFQALEKTLETTAGKFCVGDDVTVADLCLIPQFANAKRFGVDVTPFPLICRIVEECGKLEAFRKADPSCQPDAPAEFRK